MPKNKDKEKLKRESKYSYEIDLIRKGFKEKDIELLSKNMGSGLSLRTIQRLKKEINEIE